MSPPAVTKGSIAISVTVSNSYTTTSHNSQPYKCSSNTQYTGMIISPSILEYTSVWYIMC